MSIEIVVPYTCNGGNKYLIQFKIVEYHNFDIPIIDITLVLAESKTKTISATDLFKIADIISDYLKSNNVVIYYYCDTAEINQSENNINLSPQAFRSKLFDIIFNRKANSNLLKDEIIIDSDLENSHYISLITRQENKKVLTDISMEIAKLSDK